MLLKDLSPIKLKQLSLIFILNHINNSYDHVKVYMPVLVNKHLEDLSAICCHLIAKQTFYEVLSFHTSIKTAIKTIPLLNYTSKFGCTIQVSPSGIGKYFNSFFITAAVVFFISLFCFHFLSL